MKLGAAGAWGVGLVLAAWCLSGTTSCGGDDASSDDGGGTLHPEASDDATGDDAAQEGGAEGSGDDGSGNGDATNDGTSGDDGGDAGTDAAPGDAGFDGDAGCVGQQNFQCGSTSCDQSSQYCLDVGGSATCKALPQLCLCPPHHTCACVSANVPNPCVGGPDAGQMTCTFSGPQLTITCQ